jgi:hypothetical protein
VDIYSLGVILFELFASFQAVSGRYIAFASLREQGPPDGWDGDRKQYDMMTALEPSDRPSASEVLVVICTRGAYYNYDHEQLLIIVSFFCAGLHS